MMLSDWDIATVVGLQSLLGPTWLPVAEVLTAFGGAPILLLAYTAMAGWRGVDSLIGLGVTLLCTMVLVGELKVIITAPRPWMIDSAVQAWHASDGFGMPSGHAASSMVFLGFWIRRCTPLVVTLALLIAIVLIAATRIYLGVHSPSQILAGWSLGLLMLYLLALSRQAMGRACEVDRTSDRIPGRTPASTQSARLPVSTVVTLVRHLAALPLWSQLVLCLLPGMLLSAARVWRLATVAPLFEMPTSLIALDTAARESLFEPDRIYQMALCSGMLLAAVLHRRLHAASHTASAGSAAFGLDAQLDGSERWWRLMVGSLALALLAFTALAVRDVPVALFTVMLAAPLTLLVAVPAIAASLERWWSN